MAITKKVSKKKQPLNAATVAQSMMLKEKQRYVTGYLQVIKNLYKKNTFTQEQARLAELAYKRKLPPSGYVALIRQADPHYPKTKDFQRRQGEAKAVWAQFRPNRPMPHEFSQKYVRSSLNQVQLIEQVDRSLKAQKAVSLNTKQRVIPQGHAAYAQLRTMLNEAVRKHTGADAHDNLHRMVFSAKVQDKHIDDMFPDLFGGKEAFKWMNRAESQPQPVLKPKLNTAESPFISQAQNAFDIGVNDMGAGLISSEIIK